MGTIPFTLRLDEKLKSDLEAEARREDRSASYLATKAVRTMLEARTAKRRMVEKAMLEADKGVFVSEYKISNWFNSIGSDRELPEPSPDIQIK